MAKIWHAIGTLFRALGHTLRWLRRIVLTLITAVLLLAVFGQLNPPPPTLPESGLLVVAPSGALVDQLTYNDPFAELLDSAQTPAETLLPELIATIVHAADNPAISAMLVETEHLRSADMAKILELGEALLRFRASGKPIVASADYYNQYQYLLASHADQIFLHNFGAVEIDGISASRSYFADLLERLKIDIHLFRAGDFKDAVEPLVNSVMSENSRQQLQRLVDQRWALYSERISANRTLPRGALDDLATHYAERLRDSGGDGAALALQSGLVDTLSNRVERMPQVDSWLASMDASATTEKVDSHTYAAWLRHQQQQQSNPAAVIVYTAAGEILDGHHSAGSIGGDSSSEQLQQLGLQQLQRGRPYALVVRIDSPGGSAFGSEIIREQIISIRSKGIPVVISMGSTAASGGYWIASGADYIVAQPATLTGSIGVFGLLPTLDRGLESLGVNFAQVSSLSTPSYHPQQPLSKSAATLFQSSVDGLYLRFLERVSDARQLSMESTEAIAGGQVWSGTDALQLGLIDRLGDLNQAVAAAAEIAGFSDYQVEHYQPELTAWEQFATALSQQITLLSDRIGIRSALAVLGDPTLEKTLAAPLTQLQKSFNDPHGRYLLCTLCQ